VDNRDKNKDYSLEYLKSLDILAVVRAYHHLTGVLRVLSNNGNREDFERRKKIIDILKARAHEHREFGYQYLSGLKKQLHEREQNLAGANRREIFDLYRRLEDVARSMHLYKIEILDN